jgi:hypothetical protein
VAVNVVIRKEVDSCVLPIEKTGNGLRVEVARSETVDTLRPSASVTSRFPRDPPSAHFENKKVSKFLHFPIICLSLGNLDLKPSTARQTGPWWIIPKPSVQETSTYFYLSMALQLFGHGPLQETPTPESMTARNCHISDSQRKADVLKIHKILRKTTNSSCLASKNWPKSLTGAQERDPTAYGFPTYANTC